MYHRRPPDFYRSPQSLHRRLPDFHWRSQDFRWRPQYFQLRPQISTENLRLKQKVWGLEWKSCGFFTKNLGLQWKSCGSNEKLGSRLTIWSWHPMKILSLKQKVWGFQWKSGNLQWNYRGLQWDDHTGLWLPILFLPLSPPYINFWDRADFKVLHGNYLF